MGHDQMAGRGPFCFLVAAVSRQSHQRRQNHWKRAAADHQSGHCRFEAGGQQPTNESELSRSAVPSIPSQAGYPRRDQGHGREASPSGLSHAPLRNQIRRPGSAVLRSSTAYPTDQASQAESRQAGIPPGPGSRRLKHQLREFLERTHQDLAELPFSRVRRRSNKPKKKRIVPAINRERRSDVQEMHRTRELRSVVCPGEPAWISPELEDSATKNNSLHSDAPWVYKASNTGGQNGNPNSMSFSWRSLPLLIRKVGNLGRGDLRWTRGCVCQRRNLWSRGPQDALLRSQVEASA